MNRRLFVVFLSFLLFCCPVSTLAIESVKVGIYQNEPKVFIDGQSCIPKGIFIDILDYIASKEGWQLEYLPASWDKNLNRLEQGEIDLLLDIADSERREDLFEFNKEIIFSNWAIVYVQEESKIESIIDLRNKKVAAMKGDISYADFKKKIADLGIYCTFVEVDEFSDVFELVDQKKVDAGIISRLFGLRNENVYKAKRSNIICCPNNLYFAVLKNTNKYLLERIDHHLYELKRDEQSIYYKSIMRWIEGISPCKFPVWLKWLIALFGGFFFMCMVGIAVLKKQVTTRTVQLRNANCELEGTQSDLIAKNESLNAEIEERKHMEEEKDLLQRQLIQSQKMEAIGVLAGGIAHDFNNLLYIISGNTELLIDNARPEDHESLQEIFKSTQRGADLVKQLLIFSRKVESNFKITHLNAEIKKIIIMLERTIQKMIEIQLDLTDDLYNINADQSQLEQVLLNLCINARDSMPNGGKLLIKTENDFVDEFFQAHTLN